MKDTSVKMPKALKTQRVTGTAYTTPSGETYYLIGQAKPTKTRPTRSCTRTLEPVRPYLVVVPSDVQSCTKDAGQISIRELAQERGRILRARKQAKSLFRVLGRLGRESGWAESGQGWMQIRLSKKTASNESTIELTHTDQLGYTIRVIPSSRKPGDIQYTRVERKQALSLVRAFLKD